MKAKDHRNGQNQRSILFHGRNRRHTMKIANMIRAGNKPIRVNAGGKLDKIAWRWLSRLGASAARELQLTRAQGRDLAFNVLVVQPAIERGFRQAIARRVIREAQKLAH